MSQKLGIVEALPPSAEQFWELLGMISGVLRIDDNVTLYCIAHNGELTVDIFPTGENVDFGPRGEAARRCSPSRGSEITVTVQAASHSQEKPPIHFVADRRAAIGPPAGY